MEWSRIKRIGCLGIIVGTTGGILLAVWLLKLYNEWRIHEIMTQP